MAETADAPERASAFVKGAVELVRATGPLVHCVTNLVSMDLAANAVLAAHASPAMVHAPEEASGFARIAGCVVVNVGTIDALWAEGMTAAVRAAAGSGVPVVLDPVGVGSDRMLVGVCDNGQELLTRVTAAGCALSAVCGAFLAAARPAAAADAAMSALAALAFYGGAADAAAEAIKGRGGTPGPGSMRSELLDQLHSASPQEVQDRSRVQFATIE
ncbi:hypothetical protein FNF29_05139 [Cafeteria roenbergensis]|uniref:hydroxyethylthiazole kinase n=1 Tax=Cafeteria roenbergensis TaxID=33653 RepID=A0A5A8CDD0_CAFRO|nr:hypothetical protein FNF29_05139 [Cafeteria roenbergensis]|eukprot:KAA0150564.1 hypothetical protein FNF29_05139 [Cafeteria roenbergensis]